MYQRGFKVVMRVMEMFREDLVYNMFCDPMYQSGRDGGGGIKLQYIM